MSQFNNIVIIPAYNEEQSIEKVITDIPRELIQKVIVVNNASTDQTAEIARSANADVIDEAQPGYGKACLTGIRHAEQFQPKNIIFLDGDYSDFPQEVELHLQKLQEGFDLVIGSRNLGKAQKGALLPQAIFGNWLATTLMKVLFGTPHFTDLGPFRAIRWEALKKINMLDQDFGWTVEMQVKALIHNLKCCEVSVSYRKRIGVSKITGTLVGTFKAGKKILFTIGKLYLLNRLGKITK